MQNNRDAFRELQWKPFETDFGTVTLVDVMGDDRAVVTAARTSHKADVNYFGQIPKEDCQRLMDSLGYCPDMLNPDSGIWAGPDGETKIAQDVWDAYEKEQYVSDRHLIRYLMRHRHTTPFEMAEIKLCVTCAMDTWRQWIRHRTANVNESSTRYEPALDEMQVTKSNKWRQQSTKNKQGSADYLEEDDWGQFTFVPNLGQAGPVLRHDEMQGVRPVMGKTPGEHLTAREFQFHTMAKLVYQERLEMGVAREQARKDLPLCQYTKAYWKIDLHNLLHFLSLRMDSHAQLEIRTLAKTIGEEIVKPLFPMVWEAFEDYRLGGQFLSRLDIQAIGTIADLAPITEKNAVPLLKGICSDWGKEKSRERDECVAKLVRMGLVYKE